MRKSVAILFIFCCLFSNCNAGIVQEVILEKKLPDGSSKRVTLFGDSHLMFGEIASHQSEMLKNLTHKLVAQFPSTLILVESPPQKFRNLYIWLLEFSGEHYRNIIKLQSTVKDRLAPLGEIGNMYFEEELDNARLIGDIKHNVIEGVLYKFIEENSSLNNVQAIDERIFISQIHAIIFSMLLYYPLLQNIPEFKALTQEIIKFPLKTSDFVTLIFDYLTMLENIVKKLDHNIAISAQLDEIKYMLNDYSIFLSSLVIKEKPFFKVIFEKNKLIYKGLQHVSWEAMPDDLSILLSITAEWEKHFLTLFDLVAFDKIISSPSLNIVLITGFIHVNNLVSYFEHEDYKVTYNSHLILKNGQQVGEIHEIGELYDQAMQAPLSPLPDEAFEYPLQKPRQADECF